MDPAGLIDPILNLFPDWAKPLLVLWFLWGIIVFWTLMHQGDGRTRWLRQINGGLANLYRRKLRRALGITSKQRFKDQFTVNRSRHLPTAWLGVNTFSEPAFRFTLTLAFMYPILSLLMFWSITGQGGAVGALQMLPLNMPSWQCWLVVGSLVLELGLAYQAIHKGGWKRSVYISISVAFAVAGAVVFAVAVAVAGAVGGAILLNVMLDKLYHLARQRGYLAWYWLGFIGFYILLALGGIYSISLLPHSAHTQDAQLLLLFYVLLPLINATWDWLSLGVTRSLLYAIVDKVHSGWQAFIWALFDGVLALVFLFFITLTTTAVIALMNRVSRGGGGETIVDLNWIFDSLRFDALSPDHWWLYFMFFSTLIPTCSPHDNCLAVGIIVDTTQNLAALDRELERGAA